MKVRGDQDMFLRDKANAHVGDCGGGGDGCGEGGVEVERVEVPVAGAETGGVGGEGFELCWLLAEGGGSMLE